MTGDDSIRESILAEVDAATSELVDFTASLIACRTDSQTEGNEAFEREAERCQDLIADELAAIGLEITRFKEEPRYPVVAGKLPGQANGRSLAVNGHIDVVPVGDPATWSYDPWCGTVADGALWGRGACDMKGGVAAAIFAAKAIAAAGFCLDGDLWFHIVADEEVVGNSTRNLAKRSPPIDAIINAEPTELRIMPVEGGLVHFRIEIDGKESHAGNRYKGVHAGGYGDSGGVNAIEKMIIIIGGLQALEREWAIYRRHPLLPPGFNTILPGVIVGGPGGGTDGRLNLVSNPGTTPNYCAAEFNLWYLPEETIESVQEEIEARVYGIASQDPWLRDHPPRFTWKLRNIWFPPVDTPLDHPFIEALAGVMTDLGLVPTIEAFTAASELAWYAEEGMDGTTFGPGSIAQAHGVDEFVTIQDLVDSCRVMALTMAGWCGVQQAG